MDPKPNPPDPHAPHEPNGSDGSGDPRAAQSERAQDEATQASANLPDMPAGATSSKRPELGADGWPIPPAKPNSPFDASTPKLLAMLGHAFLHLGFNRISLAKRQFMISFFGMVALITPLILWMAWTKMMLLIFSAIGVFSVAALLIIVWLSPEDEL